MNLQPIKGKKKSPRRIMLMGTNYVGKSTLAAQAPDVFFLDLENGLDDIDCERSPVISTAESLFQWMLWLASQKYKWVAIDCLEGVERLIQDQVVKDKGAKSFGDPCFDFGRGRKHCQPLWDRFVRGIKWLQKENNMGVIFLTHVEPVEVKPPDAESYHRYEPPLDKDIRETICDWCSEILFLNFRDMSRKTDDGFNRERTIAVNGERERYIRTRPTTGVRAKNRLRLPEEILFGHPGKTWQLIQQHIDKAVPEPEPEPEPVVEEQVVEAVEE